MFSHTQLNEDVATYYSDLKLIGEGKQNQLFPSCDSDLRAFLSLRSVTAVEDSPRASPTF